MRVLMVGPWRLDSMRRQVNWLAESGVEVLVADFRRRECSTLPSSVRRVGLWPARDYAVGHSGMYKKSSRSVSVGALRLRAIADNFQPHVVHSYMLGSPHTNICLQAGLRPLVVSVWGSLNRLMEPGTARRERRLLSEARTRVHTLLVDNPNQPDALGGLSIEPLQVVCLPVGVDGRLFHDSSGEKSAAWRFVLDISPDAIVLLSPRGWSHTYGQQHIMRAFADAYHRLKRPLVLILRGLGRTRQPEKLAQEVYDLGASLGVGHAIRWIPTIPFEDLPGVYALADIVINYPRRDAFPSTLLEAAACARPVITSDLPAYRNTFVERFCWLVEPENPVALADTIVEMVSGGHASWAANVQTARQVVLAEYDENTQKQRLMALYHRIIAERTQKG